MEMELRAMDDVDVVIEDVDDRSWTDATLAFVPYPSTYAKAEATVRCPM